MNSANHFTDTSPPLVPFPGILMSDRIAIRVGSTPPASLSGKSSLELAKCIAYVPCRNSRRNWRYSSATSLLSSTTRMLTITRRPHRPARQADRELSEFALPAVDFWHQPEGRID